MSRPLALDDLLALSEGELATALRTDGPVEVALPGVGPSHILLSENGAGYQAEIRMNGTRVAALTCDDVPTLLRFVRQTRL